MTDWKALCAELISALADFTPLNNRELAALDRARAALAAEAAPPAEGELGDEDLGEHLGDLIDKWCQEGMQVKPYGTSFPLAHYVASRAYQYGLSKGHHLAPVSAEVEVGKNADVRRMCEIILGNTFGNKELDSLALLVGHHPDVLNASPVPAPVPAEGEVAELVAALRADAECAEVEHYDLCNMTAEQMHRAADLLERLASPACVVLKPSPELIEAFQDALPGRIEPLLEQRHPEPVPVAERLPGPEDCDGEGRVWWLGVDTWMLRSYALIEGTAIPLGTHWLPATALPLPAGEV